VSYRTELQCQLCGRLLDPNAGPGSGWTDRRATWAQTRCHGPVHVVCLRRLGESPCADDSRTQGAP